MSQYWLFKSEPNCFSIDDLEQVGTEPWDGIRNYQARNMLRDDCKIGDKVIFYHSSCKVPGAVGIMEVVKESYPDHTAFDPNSEHPDPKSDPKNPRWFMVDVKFIKKFKNLVSLKTIKSMPEFKDMKLVQRGNRLSLFQISKEEFELINNLSEV